MPRAANSPGSPEYPMSHNDWFNQWCKEQRSAGGLCTRKLASVAWRKEKARYRSQLHGPPLIFLNTGPSDYMDEDEDEDEDEDFIYDVDSLNASPVGEQEQLPPSPLFSELEPDLGPSISDEPHPTGPFVFDQGPSTEPRRVVLELPYPGPSSTNQVTLTEPSLNTDQSSFAVPSPSADGPPVDSPQPVSHSTPVLHHPIPVNNVVNEPDFSLLDEIAYTYQVPLPPVHGLTFSDDLWDETSYDATTTETHQFGFPTPVPTTPVTGYNALQTPWYTPGLQTQPLPTGLDDIEFAFNNVEAPTVPAQQQTWNNNNYESSESFPQLSVEPPTPAPALAPTLAPVPEIGGQFNQMAGFQDNPYQWNGVSNVQMFENNQLQVPQAPPVFVQNFPQVPAVLDQNFPQAPPIFNQNFPQAPPVFNQNIPPGSVQQVLNAVNTNTLGQEGKRLGLVGLQLWFTPT